MKSNLGKMKIQAFLNGRRTARRGCLLSLQIQDEAIGCCSVSLVDEVHFRPFTIQGVHTIFRMQTVFLRE